jgi:hypothetical protein
MENLSEKIRHLANQWRKMSSGDKMFSDALGRASAEPGTSMLFLGTQLEERLWQHLSE